MTVRSIIAFREEQRAVPILEVRRVLSGNRQGVKCWGQTLRGRHFECGAATQYIITTIGSKVGKFACKRCLEPMLRKLLLAPPEEYPERERERIDALKTAQAGRERAARRAAHTGCAGHTEKNTDNFCPRPPVARAHWANRYGTDGNLLPAKPYCARHIVRFRRSKDAIIAPIGVEALPIVQVTA